MKRAGQADVGFDSPFDALGAMASPRPVRVVADRTAVVAQGKVMVQMGGGIVADSDPASEWSETVAKGERLVRVLDAGFSGSASPAAPR